MSIHVVLEGISMTKNDDSGQVDYTMQFADVEDPETPIVVTQSQDVDSPVQNAVNVAVDALGASLV